MTDWQLDKRRKGTLPAYQYWFRKAGNYPPRGLLKCLYKAIYAVISFAYKVEIPASTKIGPGLYIGHPYCITVNPKAVIGRNCNLHRGVLIGQENRGPRKGAPTIGDDVWIGINAAIIGNVRIGNDVLIAPNAYVNCDVPDHSVVFGNPCVIKHRPNATENYINNRI